MQLLKELVVAPLQGGYVGLHHFMGLDCSAPNARGPMIVIDISNITIAVVVPFLFLLRLLLIRIITNHRHHVLFFIIESSLKSASP